MHFELLLAGPWWALKEIDGTGAHLGLADRVSVGCEQADAKSAGARAQLVVQRAEATLRMRGNLGGNVLELQRGDRGADCACQPQALRFVSGKPGHDAADLVEAREEAVAGIGNQFLETLEIGRDRCAFLRRGTPDCSGSL
jgi:hypothetical protein